MSWIVSKAKYSERSCANHVFIKVLPYSTMAVFFFTRDHYQLAQLEEYRTTMREGGFKPRPDQHSGSLNNRGESAAFVTLQIVILSSLLG